MEAENTKNVLSLPDEILDKILSYAAFDEVSHLREVCKRFNASGQRILNQGFYRVEKYHSQCLRKVKEQLPRRESERRKHRLSTHCEILTAIETRLSLLGMTFMKYVELKLCCFFPGKVLDEIFRILRLISSVSVPPRPHEVLQELRDISSMAMEHFDEKIAPSFRFAGSSVPKVTVSYGTLGGLSQQRYTVSSVKNDSKSASCNAHAAKIHVLMKVHGQRYMEFKRENNDLRRRIAECRRQLHELTQEMANRDEIIVEQNARITEQEGKIAELSGKFAKYDEAVGEVLNSVLVFRDDKQESQLNKTPVGVPKSCEPQDETVSEASTSSTFTVGKRKRQDCLNTAKNKKPCGDPET